MVSSWRPENSFSAGAKVARRGIWVAAPLASLLVAAVATAEPTSPIAVAIPQRDLAPAIATSETPATPPLAPPEVTGFIQIRHQTVIDSQRVTCRKLASMFIAIARSSPWPEDSGAWRAMKSPPPLTRATPSAARSEAPP